jgi:hypothetical protein
MAARRTLISAPTKKVLTKKTPRKTALIAKKAVAKHATAGRTAGPSKASIMLDELRPSVDALHDRVEKLRLRFG